MYAKLIALAIMLPYAAVFIYAGVHEFRRYKTHGTANYGLVYDEATGTTHVTGIADHEEAWNPDDFDPAVHNDRGAEGETDGEAVSVDDDENRKA